MTGRRIEPVQTEERNGSLAFRLASRGDDGNATIFWEIAKSQSISDNASDRPADERVN